MKVFVTLIVSCLVVFVAAKKSAQSTSAKSTNCDERLPMSALDCCGMPQFMNETLIGTCRQQAISALANTPPTGKPDGPPEEFFKCLVSTCGMTSGSGAKEVVDQAKALKYLQDQLNSTTTKDWSPVVRAGVSTCYKVYQKDNTAKGFLDCLIAELYTTCPNAKKTGECPKYQSHVKNCKVLKLDYPRPAGASRPPRPSRSRR